MFGSVLLALPSPRLPAPRMSSGRLPLAHRPFGLELELSVSGSTSLSAVRNKLSGQTSRGVFLYDQQVRQTTEQWKLIPDSSITCLDSMPNCNTFELVSPILRGGQGLSETHRVLEHGLSRVPGRIAVNKQAGFHVHVDVTGVKGTALRRICQNWCKYEDAIDLFMPPSRRGDDNKFCRSNRRNSQLLSLSNREVNDRLARCNKIGALASLMNPEPRSRYYKLNLQNLVNNRQRTIEFRHHSATYEYPKISNWVRFLIAFVEASLENPAPDNFLDHRTAEQKLERLFEWVVKDRLLRNFYYDRANQLRAR